MRYAGFVIIDRMTVSDISSKIKKTPTNHKPVIIAVEGFGGSGKSTFSRKLKEVLGDAYVIETDDFFINDKPSDADKTNFDRKRLEEQVLRPLRNGRLAAYQRLEYITNTLTEPVKVPNVSYLIIEGVSSFHPSILEYMDYKIWIEAPRDVAEERMRKRDKDVEIDTDDLREHWTKTYQEYVDLYHPEKMADFVFDNS